MVVSNRNLRTSSGLFSGAKMLVSGRVGILAPLDFHEIYISHEIYPRNGLTIIVPY